MAIRVWHISYVEAIGKPLFMMSSLDYLCLSAYDGAVPFSQPLTGNIVNEFTLSSGP